MPTQRWGHVSEAVPSYSNTIPAPECRRSLPCIQLTLLRHLFFVRETLAVLICEPQFFSRPHQRWFVFVPLLELSEIPTTRKSTTDTMTSVKQLFSLEGQTALVTGGTRGIGQSMAIALAEAGADILLVQVSSLHTSIPDSSPAIITPKLSATHPTIPPSKPLSHSAAKPQSTLRTLAPKSPSPPFSPPSSKTAIEYTSCSTAAESNGATQRTSSPMMTGKPYCKST